MFIIRSLKCSFYLLYLRKYRGLVGLMYYLNWLCVIVIKANHRRLAIISVTIRSKRTHQLYTYGKCSWVGILNIWSQRFRIFQGTCVSIVIRFLIRYTITSSTLYTSQYFEWISSKETLVRRSYMGRRAHTLSLDCEPSSTYRFLSAISFNNCKRYCYQVYVI